MTVGDSTDGLSDIIIFLCSLSTMKITFLHGDRDTFPCTWSVQVQWWNTAISNYCHPPGCTGWDRTASGFSQEKGAPDLTTRLLCDSDLWPAPHRNPLIRLGHICQRQLQGVFSLVRHQPITWWEPAACSHPSVHSESTDCDGMTKLQMWLCGPNPLFLWPFKCSFSK